MHNKETNKMLIVNRYRALFLCYIAFIISMNYPLSNYVRVWLCLSMINKTTKKKKKIYTYKKVE